MVELNKHVEWAEVLNEILESIIELESHQPLLFQVFFDVQNFFNVCKPNVNLLLRFLIFVPVILYGLMRLLCRLKISTEVLGTHILNHADHFGTLGVFNDFLNLTVAANDEVVTDVGLDLITTMRDWLVFVLNSIQWVHIVDLRVVTQFLSIVAVIFIVICVQDRVSANLDSSFLGAIVCYLPLLNGLD